MSGAQDAQRRAVDPTGDAAREGDGRSRVEFSAAQRQLWHRREAWVSRLHGRWRHHLSRADCEEVIADAILNSRILRDARRLDGGLVCQWWAIDVKSAAITRDNRLRGSKDKDGARRGHPASLDAPGRDGVTPLVSLLPGDGVSDPAELVTEGLLGQSRRYRREQATVIYQTAVAQLKPRYREILQVELEGDGQPQHVLCQQLGLTEKAYQARLAVAKQQFAKHVRAQRLGPQCEEIRARLGTPLGAHAARVEAHLEDCYPCRAWQLFHRDHAAAALVPFPLLAQWDALSARWQSVWARATPAAEATVAHADAAAGAGVASTAAGGALLAGGGVKVATALCVSAVSCSLALGTQRLLTDHAPPGSGPAVAAETPRGTDRSRLRPRSLLPARATRSVAPVASRASTAPRKIAASTVAIAKPAGAVADPIAPARERAPLAAQEFAPEPATTPAPSPAAAMSSAPVRAPSAASPRPLGEFSDEFAPWPFARSGRSVAGDLPDGAEE